MATTPLTVLNAPYIRPYTVDSASIVTAGYPVKFGSSDDKILNCAAIGDDSFAIALESGTAGQTVSVILFGPVVPVKVGTGGATRGQKAKCVADGLTNAVVGGGTVKATFHGIFMQSGVVGDLVGMQLINNGSVGS